MSWSEESRRYITTEPEFYFPDKWRKKADNVKQGSSDEVFEAEPLVPLKEWRGGAAMCSPPELLKYNVIMYEKLLEAGVAPEQARMILPQNMMTTWVWTGTLLAWVHMLQLRLDAHTQKESRDFAAMVRDIIQPLYPVSYAALMEG